ncbi:WD-40 repeat-containing protein (plasmid) [Stanieria cyanosphaera PCC 7437]|uniref:WD-40 repeat-containing protein n=1 Tax=Stanieria cyanosphaera (strain ATCC 29371 / PCC 7437) TaxID=111780 RepID=K9Y1H8_STAC7|nr:caspase family protein [Stanieria cyanosphaera]AFZ38261.1 WD-40 repeat-containing protein [Stanieria cyanosphaera PCC 7437]
MSYPVNSNEKETNTGKLWIVLVGVNTYQDKTISTLNYCANDCRELAEVLTIANQNQQTEIIALYDGGEKKPTRNEVISSIRKFGSAKPENTILFYFSGHGYLNSNNRPVFCVADTQIENLTETSISLDFILREIKNSQAQNQLIWLDACQSVDSENNETNQNLTGQLLEILNERAVDSQESTNFYVILSCDKKEKSIQIKSLKHSLFTYFLIQGLQGKAANDKGEIEVDQLYFYVLERVKNYLKYQKNKNDRIINNSEQKSVEESQTTKAMVRSTSYNLLNIKLCDEKSQTPSRITSGSRKLIIGLATPPHARKALIVDSLWNAIANINLCKILQTRGGFEVDYRYLKEQENYNVRDTIDSYLQDNDTKTVLLYLAVNINSTSEPELVFDAENKISLNWLAQQLQTSVVREIVIIIDRLEIQNPLNLSKTLNPNKNKSICLITATTVEPSQRKFIQQLITILKGVKETEFWASELITQLQKWSRKKTNINLDCWLSGTTEVMEILLPEVQRSNNRVFEIDICPFKSLKSFDVDDAYFFHGREALIQEILDKLQSTSFLAVVGASGSGKSSVVKAGVVPQLISQGLYISEQEQFQSCKTWIIRPTDLLQPQNDNILAALASQLQPDNRELQSISVLVIDQFEELFTASVIDRNNFLDLIIGAISQTGDRFKVIITLRDDFLQECLAMSQLAHLIAQNNVLVPSCLDEEDYRQIITQPAKKVGLEVEFELVNLLLQELEAGSLPLLQFVLEDLYIKRKDGTLTLAIYQQEIGELRSILGQKAQETYNKLNSEQQKCAKWIFLSLVQLGEGTEDTRRRLQISELIVDKYKDVFDATLQTLIEARLLVVSRETTFPTPKPLPYQEKEDKPEEESNSNRENIVTVEVAHEILIRNWDTLRWWLQENRDRLRLMRELEQKTYEWEQTHSSQKDGFLLPEAALAKYEEFYINNPDELPTRVHQFMGLSIEKRDRLKEADRKRLEREIKLRKTAQRRAKFLAIAFIVAIGLTGVAIWKGHQSNINEINALINTSEAQLASNQEFDALLTGLKAGRKIKDNKLGVDTKTKIKEMGALQNIFYRVKEFNRLEGHQDGVREIKLSPDGKLIASASEDKTIKLWNFKGKLLTTLKTLNVHSGSFDNMILSPDGKLIASVSSDRTVKLWNLKGKLLTTLNGHTGLVENVTFSPDSQTLASASSDKTVKLWNLKGKLLATLNGHTGSVYGITFSPDGQTLASSSSDKTVKLWNLKGKLLWSVKDHINDINTVIFSPNGQTLASASNDQTIKLWNLQGELLYTLKGHTGWVGSLAFSPDGQTLASISSNQVKLWNLKGKLLTTLDGHTDVFHSIAFSPDGKTIASASSDKTVKLWNLQGELLATLNGHTDSVYSLAFSPDGKTIASASSDKTVKLWNLKEKLLWSVKSHTEPIDKVAFSPDGQTITSASGYKKSVELWNLQGKLLATLERSTDMHHSIMLSPNGQAIASIGLDHVVKLWNLQGELIATLDGHNSQVESIAFSPNSQTVASASDYDKTVKLWNLKGELLATLNGHTDQIYKVVFSPDGKTIASASSDNTVRLWNLKGELLATLNNHKDYLINSVIFSPDGKTIAFASSDNNIASFGKNSTVKLWNLKGELLATFNGHQDSINSVIFSPDGQLIASASSDNTVKLWNLQGKLLATLNGHTNRSWVSNIAFSPDGRTIASASGDSTIKLWSLDLDDVLTRGCDWARDYLTNNPNVSESDRYICDGI